MAKVFDLLRQLPEELLQDILSLLEDSTLTALNLTSRWCYRVATPLIWREVNLQDCRGDPDPDVDDHHDDTPLLRKLLIIAKNPWIGSCVTTLTHSCHLPPPAIFHELPRTPLSGHTLSPDPRTTKLVQLAVKNMENVQTLRIIFGHPNINDALLRCFFDKHRRSSIRRLWLESCRISAGCDLDLPYSILKLPLELDYSGLESVRFRRLPLRPAMPIEKPVPLFQFNYARGNTYSRMQDGAGSVYRTTTNDAGLELQLSYGACSNTSKTDYEDTEALAANIAFANLCDARIYDSLGEEAGLPREVHTYISTISSENASLVDRGPWLDPNLDEVTNQMPEFKSQRERKPSSHVMAALLKSCSSTLTNLCLDWVFTMPYYNDLSGWTETFALLFSLHFPHLKSFQLRNAVVPDTIIPTEFFLLDQSKIHQDRAIYDEESEEIATGTSSHFSLCGLEFMERHPNLQCLAWPMESFFSRRPMDSSVVRRVEAVIENLAWTLVDLRVDTMYSGTGEPQSESNNSSSPTERERRRRFISEFAAKMLKVESIKIEGGVPRDERREIIRALHRCSISKIVMIGVCCPVGNTWGAGGRDLNETLDSAEIGFLEAEHKDAIHGLGFTKPDPVAADYEFEAAYGWPPGPPMIHTIAACHAQTIRELKFCGYKGAPVLFVPTPITHPLLAPLKHFHHLESLILSMWFNTEFEEEHRDSDIIKYWLESRSPMSTSLVRITDEEPEGWEKELRTKYAPDALAWWVTGFIGQYLSEQAKARENGVHVRISLCIGDWGGIFDIDLRIGKGALNSDICLGFKGPREELEPERRRSKLESRRWF